MPPMDRRYHGKMISDIYSAYMLLFKFDQLATE